MKAILILHLTLLCAIVHPTISNAASEVIRVVKQGDAVTTQGWPANTLKLVNDPLRTDGWQVFSSVGVQHPQGFEFSPRTHQQVQHLIDLFAGIRSEQLRIRFAKGKEPQSIVWPVNRNILEAIKQRDAVGPVGMIYAGKGTVAVLSIGTRKAIDIIRSAELPDHEKQRLYQFPTLTLYVGNDFVDPQRLKIPDHIVATDVKTAADRGRRASGGERLAPPGLEIQQPQWRRD